MSTRELSSWERVTTEIVQFIQTRHIDSFQKLRVLIFFHEHPESSWTSSQIAARLYLGDGPLLEKVIADLQAAGLVGCMANRCKLSDEAGIRLPLQHLVKTCENPLARQEIFDTVRRRGIEAALRPRVIGPIFARSIGRHVILNYTKLGGKPGETDETREEGKIEYG